MPLFFPRLISRNREHATVLASNFPHGISDDQVRHFFKEVVPFPTDVFDHQCGTIKQVERTGDEEEGGSFVIEFENEVPLSRLQPLTFLGRSRICYDEKRKDVSGPRDLGQQIRPGYIVYHELPTGIRRSKAAGAL
jgi:hypothetical protein